MFKKGKGPFLSEPTDDRKAVIGKQRDEGGKIKQALQSTYPEASTELEEKTFHLDDVLVKSGNTAEEIAISCLRKRESNH